MMNNHIISKDITLLEALSYINAAAPDPLVLFVLDNEDRMVGTLTDGDSRRALIAGASVEEKVEKIMHRDFNYIKIEDIDDVREIKRQRNLNMKLVPVLDEEKHIVETINLEKYHSRLPFDAILMAGGKGERLRPLTLETPKPLLKVGDKCIIDHNIDRLISYGVKHISVTVNYLKGQMEEHFSEPRGEVQIKTIREPKFLGTIGSVKYVENFHNDTVLVMNSDLFTNINYEDFFLHFKQHDAEMSLAAVPYDISIPYGILDLDGHEIRGLIEKPKFNYYTNAGIYLIKRRALDEIPADTFFHATDLVEKLIDQKKKVIRYPLAGYWIDIGNPDEYYKACEMAKHI
jgi:dTDP-glucose pyrophosphorylase